MANPAWSLVDTDELSSGDLLLDQFVTRDGDIYIEIDSRTRHDIFSLKELYTFQTDCYCDSIYGMMLAKDTQITKHYARLI